jgi:hypothetical protein
MHRGAVFRRNCEALDRKLLIGSSDNKRPPAGGTAIPGPALVGLLILWVGPVAALDMDARVKWLGGAAFLPAHDFQRQQTATPALDQTLDMRLMLKHKWRRFELIADHSTTMISGDSFAFANAPQSSLDAAPADDDVRLMDLTADIEDGNRHRSLHRLDRLALQFTAGDWAVTAGRDAVSWGSGLAFSPMDILSPFAPTVVDQDFKAGDDLLLIERVLKDGSDLQVLAVGRRKEGHVTSDAMSLAVKWHTFVGGGEMELLAAKHYEDDVFAVSTSVPLGGALFRADVVATRLMQGGTRWSVVANIAYSVVLYDTFVYLFAEYYRNGFGVTRMPRNALDLPEALTVRLGRGETFTVMRDYTAVGLSVPWHPLVSQSFVLLSNLSDGSSLVQTSVSFEQGDASRWQFGFVKPLGRAGDEYGGVPLAGSGLTAGGGTRAFARWVYYF